MLFIFKMIGSSQTSETPSICLNLGNIILNDQIIINPAFSLAAQARTSFIIKVYFILLLELAITFGMYLLVQYALPCQQFQLPYEWVFIFPVVQIIAIMAVALCVSKSREYSFDMILLFFFVIAYGYLASFACSTVKQISQGPVVIQAVIATLIITTSQTIYAYYVNISYRIIFAVIIVISLTAMTMIIVALVSMSPVLIIIYCALAVILYETYLVVITKMIIGDDENMIEFPLDNYIIASILLYLYIMKIFFITIKMFASFKN